MSDFPFQTLAFTVTTLLGIVTWALIIFILAEMRHTRNEIFALTHYIKHYVRPRLLGQDDVYQWIAIAHNLSKTIQEYENKFLTSF